MIIRIILILIILGIFIWFIRSRSISHVNAIKKLGLIVFILLAIISVLFPSITTFVANLVGVGKGADLLLYLLTLAFLFFVLNQYNKSKDEEKKINELSRKIALMEARKIKTYNKK